MVSTKPYRRVAKVYSILSECLMNTRSSDKWMMCCVDVYDHSFCDNIFCYFTPTLMFPQFTKKNILSNPPRTPQKTPVNLITPQ